MQDLLTKIIERQGAMSDRAFALRLGVSYNQWNQTKRRNPAFPLGWAILTGVVRLYPELRDDVTAYMASVGEARHEERDREAASA